jgi:acetyl esterase/lipase
MLKEFYPKGISFASVNYPLLTSTNVLGILMHTEEAVTFIRSKAKEWNIDPNRVAVMGRSAGAIIAEYLTYWANLGITACFAEQQPYRSAFLLLRMTRGEPPLILYTTSGPKDEVHHPKHAQRVKKHCDRVGIPCELYGSEPSGLPPPPGNDINRRAIRILTGSRNPTGSPDR